MLPFTERGTNAPSLVFMPFLAGTQQEWTETLLPLAGKHRCITLDLPGFGAASAIPGYSVSEMASAVIELLSSLSLDRYVLVGHSMAGKVSAVVARRLLADSQPVPPPVALVLVAPSPPGPEPMSGSKRAEMLHSLGNSAQLHLGRYTDRDRPAAEDYVRNNTSGALPEAQYRRTVDNVLLTNPAAWTAWLENGSKEDWSHFVDIVDLPTLVVAGTDDAALGPRGQRAATLPHFPHAQLAELHCSHLVPLERPDELASLITSFVEKISIGASL